MFNEIAEWDASYQERDDKMNVDKLIIDSVCLFLVDSTDPFSAGWLVARLF